MTPAPPSHCKHQSNGTTAKNIPGEETFESWILSNIESIEAIYAFIVAVETHLGHQLAGPELDTLAEVVFGRELN